jgi:hypothetical protein
MVKQVVTKVECFVFFGAELSENKEFTSAALELPQIIVLTAEILRICPRFIKPLETPRPSTFEISICSS